MSADPPARGIASTSSVAEPAAVDRGILDWLDSRRMSQHFAVEPVPFRELDSWRFEPDTGNLVHVDGRFFSIEGLQVATNIGPAHSWDQPIIVQPEIGILGLLSKVMDGVRHYLLQAKMEPGNINLLQLSPTVQATQSNYRRAHRGQLPRYIEYFLDQSSAPRLVDQLQSEQGSRFLTKRNRNMILDVAGDVPIDDDFRWLTLPQIKSLLETDNLINMDARSVLSCIPSVDQAQESPNRFGDDFPTRVAHSRSSMAPSHRTMNELISWFAGLKTETHLDVRRVPLNSLSTWRCGDWDCRHRTEEFFRVIGVSVEAQNREVSSWSQPLLREDALGLVGFVVQEIGGVMHFLVQAKLEPGNRDLLELAPTVSCSRYEARYQAPDRPHFMELFVEPELAKVRYSTVQSEEGGRFFHFLNQNMIVEMAPTERLDLPEHYSWMTMRQIQELVRHSYFNIEARSLLAYAALP